MAQAEEARRQMQIESAHAQVLEDVILGRDTNDEDVLRARAAEWLEANGFGADVLDDYDGDAPTCIADQVFCLSPEEVMEQLQAEHSEEEIDRLVRAKLDE